LAALLVALARLARLASRALQVVQVVQAQPVTLGECVAVLRSKV
jgi:hypothetical protein